ncbi:MAG: YlbF family regulator [Coprococcus sp.]
MDDIINLSRQINQNIRESDVYKNYLRSKQKMQERPDLLKDLSEFRHKSYELQNNEGLDNPFDEVNNLFMEYDVLLHDTVVNEFIRAEQKLCRMMRMVYENIADGLELDIIE